MAAPNWRSPVSSPKASGTFVDAVKSAGSWEFTTLELEVEGSGERIDILAERWDLIPYLQHYT